MNLSQRVAWTVSKGGHVDLSEFTGGLAVACRVSLTALSTHLWLNSGAIYQEQEDWDFHGKIKSCTPHM